MFDDRNTKLFLLIAFAVLIVLLLIEHRKENASPAADVVPGDSPSTEENNAVPAWAVNNPQRFGMPLAMMIPSAGAQPIESYPCNDGCN